MRNIFLYGFFLFCITSKADNLQYDIYTGNKYFFTNTYREVKVSSLNLYEEIDYKVDYFINMRDTVMQKKLKDKFFKIGFVTIDSAGLLENVIKFHNEYVVNYIQNNRKTLDNRGEYSDNVKLFSPLIDQVELNILAVCNNIITVERIIEFKSKYEDLEIENIEYRQVFYFDIRNLREYRIDDFFLPTTLTELNKSMSDKIIETYKTLETTKDKNSDYYDEGDDDYEEDAFYSQINKQEKRKDNQLKDYSALRTGYWIFTFPILKYCIQENHSSTADFDGEELSLKIQYQFISKYISPAGPMSFIKNPNLFISSVKNCNQIHSINYNGEAMVYNSREVFNGINQFFLHIDYGPKLIKIYSDKQSLKKEKVLRTELEYNMDGNLVKMVQHNFDENKKIDFSIIYTDVNHLKLLKQIIGQKDGKLISKSDFKYDMNGNLLKIEQYEINEEVRIQEYFYKDTICIHVDGDIQERNQRLQLQYFSKNSLCKMEYYSDGYFNSYTYKYDKNANLLYSNEVINDMEITDRVKFRNASYYAYNEKNQILSNEFDGNYFLYLYDEHSRCNQTIYIGRDENEGNSYIAKYNANSQITEITWMIGRSNTPMVFIFEYN